ncbi:hypothetical protein P7K49_017122 [Saguinus oedipus]|uniref:Uncharacterized protein n=1 Tax=Saguinus oedipus TaxID=9490 RepID=A0ABQ9V2A5_SAGOE|nr:hypothetical protein P7K49_017122 [Saguinus oedipus]
MGGQSQARTAKLRETHRPEASGRARGALGETRPALAPQAGGRRGCGGGRTGRVCTRGSPSDPTQGAPGPDPGTAEADALAPAQSETPSQDENPRRRRSPPRSRSGAARGVPGHTHWVARASPPRQPASGGRSPSSGSWARGSAHLAVRVPERPAAASPRLTPAWFPAPGSPECRRMDGRRRRPAAPRSPCTGSRCARILRARGELWLRVCDPRAGSALPQSLLPPASRPPAVIWSRSCRPLAAAAGRAAPSAPAIPWVNNRMVPGSRGKRHHPVGGSTV